MRFFVLLGILYQAVFIASAPAASFDSCGICAPANPHDVLEITARSVAKCRIASEDPVVCEELSYWDGSECGAVRAPQGLSPEACTGFQAVLGTICPCDGAPSETALLRRRRLQTADTLSVIFAFILDLLDAIFAFINGL